MAADVREAHERLKLTSALKADRPPPPAGEWLELCRDDFNDIRTVINGWSADHPSDEHDPAHADWLLASGLTAGTAPAGNVYYDWALPKWGVDKEFFLRFTPDPEERAESWTVEVMGVYADDAPGVTPGETYGTGLLYQRDFTRGQVRELCRSLRAPLPETN